jgi:hypothetical protein
VVRTLLHILTRPGDVWPKEIASLQRKDGQNKIEVHNLTVEDPDYHLLLKRIFEADSVQVW